MKSSKLYQKRGLAWLIVIALLLGMVPASTSLAAKKVSLSKKTMKLKVKQTKKLTLKNNKKKVQWTVISGKGKIQLKAKTKKGVKIVAKKAGKAVVQAKVGKKKYKCKVTVTGKAASGSDDDTSASEQPSESDNPEGSDDPSQPTNNPGGSANPSQPTNNPGGSANPSQTNNPGSSSNPSQTNNPGSSSNPSQTNNPGSSSNPSQTNNPGSSSNPSQTNNPGSSSNPSQTNNPGSSSNPSQTKTPEQSSSPSQPTTDPTQTGGEVDLGSKTVFNIGSRKLALGISKADVLTVIGSATRIEKSPQNYDVIVYNPGGTYNGYTLIYLKDDVVVSICAVGTAGTVSYGDMVKTGDKASTLSSGSEWKPQKWFQAKDGESKVGEGAYECKDTNVNGMVLAYVDLHRENAKKTVGNAVYCIQVYSATIDFDDLTKPAKCTYDNEILRAMEKETAELLIAYRVSMGYPASSYPHPEGTTGKILNLKVEDGLTTVARNGLNKNKTGSDKPPATQDGLTNAILKENGNNVPLYSREVTMAGCADSIGFANFVIEEKTASKYIASLSHEGKTVYSTSYYYCFQYFGVAAVGETKKYANMSIVLVDRWYTSDPKWYIDDDDGYE